LLNLVDIDPESRANVKIPNQDPTKSTNTGTPRSESATVFIFKGNKRKIRTLGGTALLHWKRDNQLFHYKTQASAWNHCISSTFPLNPLRSEAL